MTTVLDEWADPLPPFNPAGSSPEYEQAAWDTRNYRISCGWNEQDAQRAYEDEMTAEGYGREAEIG